MPELWPFEPQAELTERLRWNTDVRQSPDDEQRDSLSPTQQRLGYGFLMTAEELAVATGLIEDTPGHEWLVPLWHEVQQIGPVADTDTVIAVDTDAAFVGGGKAVIYDSWSSFTVVDIDTIGVGDITLTDPVGVAYASPVVAPVRTALAPGGLSFERQYHNQVAAQMTFVASDPDQTAASPFAPYLGLDVVTDVSLATSPLSGSVLWPNEVIDNGFGSIAVVNLRNILDSRYAMNWMDETLADKKRRREFLNHLRGRDRAFWLASRSREIRAAAPIGAFDGTLTIHPVLPDVTNYAGKHISIAGSIYREITGASVNGNLHNLSIAATGQAFTDPEICFLRRYRLDTDEIEITHSGERATANVPVVEVAE